MVPFHFNACPAVAPAWAILAPVTALLAISAVAMAASAILAEVTPLSAIFRGVAVVPLPVRVASVATVCVPQLSPPPVPPTASAAGAQAVPFHLSTWPVAADCGASFRGKRLSHYQQALHPSGHFVIPSCHLPHRH